MQNTVTNAGLDRAAIGSNTGDLFDARRSSRTESLVAAAVTWAEMIMRRVDGVFRRAEGLASVEETRLFRRGLSLEVGETIRNGVRHVRSGLRLRIAGEARVPDKFGTLFLLRDDFTISVD